MDLCFLLKHPRTKEIGFVDRCRGFPPLHRIPKEKREMAVKWVLFGERFDGMEQIGMAEESLWDRLMDDGIVSIRDGLREIDSQRDGKEMPKSDQGLLKESNVEEKKNNQTEDIEEPTMDKSGNQASQKKENDLIHREVILPIDSSTAGKMISQLLNDWDFHVPNLPLLKHSPPKSNVSPEVLTMMNKYKSLQKGLYELIRNDGKSTLTDEQMKQFKCWELITKIHTFTKTQKLRDLIQDFGKKPFNVDFNFDDRLKTLPGVISDPMASLIASIVDCFEKIRQEPLECNDVEAVSSRFTDLIHILARYSLKNNVHKTESLQKIIRRTQWRPFAYTIPICSNKHHLQEYPKQYSIRHGTVNLFLKTNSIESLRYQDVRQLRRITKKITESKSHFQLIHKRINISCLLKVKEDKIVLIEQSLGRTGTKEELVHCLRRYSLMSERISESIGNETEISTLLINKLYIQNRKFPTQLFLQSGLHDIEEILNFSCSKSVKGVCTEVLGIFSALEKMISIMPYHRTVPLFNFQSQAFFRALSNELGLLDVKKSHPASKMMQKKRILKQLNEEEFLDPKMIPSASPQRKNLNDIIAELKKVKESKEIQEKNLNIPSIVEHLAGKGTLSLQELLYQVRQMKSSAIADWETLIHFTLKNPGGLPIYRKSDALTDLLEFFCSSCQLINISEYMPNENESPETLSLEEFSQRWSFQNKYEDSFAYDCPPIGDDKEFVLEERLHSTLFESLIREKRSFPRLDHDSPDFLFMQFVDKTFSTLPLDEKEDFVLNYRGVMFSEFSFDATWINNEHLIAETDFHNKESIKNLMEKIESESEMMKEQIQMTIALNHHAIVIYKTFLLEKLRAALQLFSKLVHNDFTLKFLDEVQDFILDASYLISLPNKKNRTFPSVCNDWTPTKDAKDAILMIFREKKDLQWSTTARIAFSEIIHHVKDIPQLSIDIRCLFLLILFTPGSAQAAKELGMALLKSDMKDHDYLNIGNLIIKRLQLSCDAKEWPEEEIVIGDISDHDYPLIDLLSELFSLSDNVKLSVFRIIGLLTKNIHNQHHSKQCGTLLKHCQEYIVASSIHVREKIFQILLRTNQSKDGFGIWYTLFNHAIEGLDANVVFFRLIDDYIKCSDGKIMNHKNILNSFEKKDENDKSFERTNCHKKPTSEMKSSNQHYITFIQSCYDEANPRKLLGEISFGKETIQGQRLFRIIHVFLWLVNVGSDEGSSFHSQLVSNPKFRAIHLKSSFTPPEKFFSRWFLQLNPDSPNQMLIKAFHLHSACFYRISKKYKPVLNFDHVVKVMENFCIEHSTELFDELNRYRLILQTSVHVRDKIGSFMITNFLRNEDKLTWVIPFCMLKFKKIPSKCIESCQKIENKLFHQDILQNYCDDQSNFASLCQLADYFHDILNSHDNSSVSFHLKPPISFDDEFAIMLMRYFLPTTFHFYKTGNGSDKALLEQSQITEVNDWINFDHVGFIFEHMIPIYSDILPKEILEAKIIQKAELILQTIDRFQTQKVSFSNAVFLMKKKLLYRKLINHIPLEAKRDKEPIFLWMLYYFLKEVFPNLDRFASGIPSFQPSFSFKASKADSMICYFAIFHRRTIRSPYLDSWVEEICNQSVNDLIQGYIRCKYSHVLYHAFDISVPWSQYIMSILGTSSKDDQSIDSMDPTDIPLELLKDIYMYQYECHSFGMEVKPQNNENCISWEMVKKCQQLRELSFSKDNLETLKNISSVYNADYSTAMETLLLKPYSSYVLNLILFKVAGKRLSSFCCDVLKMLKCKKREEADILVRYNDDIKRLSDGMSSQNLSKYAKEFASLFSVIFPQFVSISIEEFHPMLTKFHDYMKFMKSSRFDHTLFRGNFPVRFGEKIIDFRNKLKLGIYVPQIPKQKEIFGILVDEYIRKLYNDLDGNFIIFDQINDSEDAPSLYGREIKTTSLETFHFLVKKSFLIAPWNRITKLRYLGTGSLEQYIYAHAYKDLEKHQNVQQLAANLGHKESFQIGKTIPVPPLNISNSSTNLFHLQFLEKIIKEISRLCGKKEVLESANCLIYESASNNNLQLAIRLITKLCKHGELHQNIKDNLLCMLQTTNCFTNLPVDFINNAIQILKKLNIDTKPCEFDHLTQKPKVTKFLKSAFSGNLVAK